MSTQEQEQELTEEEVAAIDAEPDVEEETGDVTETQSVAATVEPDNEPSTFSDMEAMGKKLDALTKSVATRVGTILGDMVTEFEECEICNYWNTPGWRHKGPLPEEVTEVLRVALGDHALAEFKADEYSRTCEKCNGLGFVLTGSKVSGQESLPCLACKGMGWLPIGSERGGASPQPRAFSAGSVMQPATLEQPAAPESPEIVAARALLQSQGHMVIAPFNGT